MAQPSLEELQALVQELDVLEHNYKENRLVFFEPLPTGQQAQFFADDRAAVRVILGSNRSGKTACSMNEAIAHTQGYRPWLPEDHPNRIVRLPDGEPIPVPNFGRIIAQNYQQAIKQTIAPKLEEWTPRSFVKKIVKDQRGIPVEIQYHNGSKIYLMSYDQDKFAFEGSSYHWAAFDEPMPYSIYIAVKRGLVDYGGHCWMALTPLSQPWINDILIERANVEGSGVKLYKFSIWQNCIENGGYLTRAAIEEFLADAREDELEARLHANFLHLAGRVFKSWEPTEPYWIAPYEIPQTWPRVCVIDPHSRKPIAVLWAACNPDQQWIVYRALFDKHLRTVKDVANRIKELEGWTQTREGKWLRNPERAEPIAMRIMDSSANEVERTSGISIMKKFASEQIWCQPAQKRNAQSGYDAIHEALAIKTEWAQPRLVVFNDCAPIKQNFMNFCYDDWQNDRQRDLKGDKEDYRKTNDDFIDCIRYIFQAGLTFQMLRGEANKASKRDDWEEPYNGVMIETRPGRRTGYDRRNW